MSKTQRKRLSVEVGAVTKPPKNRLTIWSSKGQWYVTGSSQGRKLGIGGEGYSRRIDAVNEAVYHGSALLAVYLQINGGHAFMLLRPALLTRGEVKAKVK